jgi:hypothetical protein
VKFPAEISGKPAVYRRFTVTVNHSVDRRFTVTVNHSVDRRLTDGFRPVRTTWVRHLQSTMMQIQMLNQFDKTRMMFITDSTRIVVHFAHVFIIDVHGEKVRIGEFRLTIETLRVDVFEGRVVGRRRRRWVVAFLSLTINVLIEMDDQLNIILQDDIVTNGTLETHVTRVFHSFASVENESYLTTIISVVGERTVSTKVLSNVFR